MTSEERQTLERKLATTDAMVWAEEFCRIFDGRQIRLSDEDEGVRVGMGTMVTWFANAMAVAEREGSQKMCPHNPADMFPIADGLSSCRKCGILVEQ